MGQQGRTARVAHRGRVGDFPNAIDALLEVRGSDTNRRDAALLYLVSLLKPLRLVIYALRGPGDIDLVCDRGKDPRKDEQADSD
jgi:hypothetical protein